MENAQLRDSSAATEGERGHRRNRSHGKALLPQVLFERVDFEGGLPLIVGRRKVKGTFHALKIGILFRPHIHGIFCQPGRRR